MPRRRKPLKLPPEEQIQSYFNQLYEAIVNGEAISEEALQFFKTYIRRLEASYSPLKENQERLRLDARNANIIFEIDKIRIERDCSIEEACDILSKRTYSDEIGGQVYPFEPITLHTIYKREKHKHAPYDDFGMTD